MQGSPLRVMQPLLSPMSRSWNKASTTCTRLGSSLHPQEGGERRKCFTVVLHPRRDTCSFLNSIKTHGVCHYCQCRWFPRAGMESRAKNQTEEKEQENRSSRMTWWSSYLLGGVGKPLTTTRTTAASPAWCLDRRAQTTTLEMRKKIIWKLRKRTTVSLLLEERSHVKMHIYSGRGKNDELLSGLCLSTSLRSPITLRTCQSFMANHAVCDGRKHIWGIKVLNEPLAIFQSISCLLAPAPSRLSGCD